MTAFLSLLFLCSQVLAQNSGSPSVFTKYTISAPGINASFIPYGARLTNLLVNDKNGSPQDVVLGYDDGTQYLNDVRDLSVLSLLLLYPLSSGKTLHGSMA